MHYKPMKKELYTFFSWIFIWSSMLCIAGCGGTKETTATAVPRPEWAEQRPMNNSYYIGIGSASKTTQPLDYQAIAKKNAMSDLTSEINVRVKGSTFLNTLEVNKTFSEEFISNITTTSDEKLENFEVAGVWENKTEFWVYYRLSKSEFQRQKAEKKNNAMRTANDHYVRGKNAEDRNELQVAVDQYFRGLFSLKEYWDEPNEYINEGGKIMLDNELYGGIQRIMNGMKILGTLENVTLSAQNNFKSNVPVQVVYNNLPVKNVVLSYRFPRERFARNKSVFTDEQGKAIIEVSQINTAEKSKQLLIEIVVDDWLPKDLDQASERELLKGAVTDKKSIPIEFIAPSFFVKSSEKMFGETSAMPSLAKAAQQALIGNGMRLAASEAAADYILSMQTNVEKGPQAQGFFVAFLQLQTTVAKNNASGEVVFQDLQSEVKGVQLNQQAAGLDAVKKGETRVTDQIIPQLMKTIF
jgi:hypothetical protein